MFSSEHKKEIAEFIQALLKSTNDPELPEGEISFLLHVDGAESYSWANIRNTSERNRTVPRELIKNTNFTR